MQILHSIDLNISYKILHSKKKYLFLEIKEHKENKTEEQEEDTQSSDSEDEVTNNTIYKKLKDMEKSIEFMAAQFDKMQKENKEIKKLLKENSKENEHLKERIMELENVIEGIEKEKVQNNIIINGIVKQEKEEKVEEVVTKVLQKLNVNAENKIIKCYRKNDQERSPIIVELREGTTKTEILQARKDIEKLTDKDCQLRGKNNTVYINEQLTNTMNKLFYSVRDLKKNKKIAYAWTREGKVYARKTDTSQKIRIKNKTDLLKLEQ